MSHELNQCLISGDARDAIRETVQSGGTTFDICLAALRIAKDQGMIEDAGDQFTGAVAAIMGHFGKGSKEWALIEKEIKALAIIDAAARGVPVDFSQMSFLEEGERSLGLRRIWQALHSGEDLDAVRKEIEGGLPAPDEKGAPDWWKEDPDRSWREFSGIQDEVSRLGCACSNAEFQRDWLRSALSKIGISLPFPHPEHPEEVFLADKGVEILAKRLQKLDEGCNRFNELADNEKERIQYALDTCPVTDAAHRLTSACVRDTVRRMREEFKGAAFRACVDDPGPAAS